MDRFGGQYLTPGEETDIDIAAGRFSDQETWEDIFGGNSAGERRLVELVGWAYRAYGVVVAINPVRADCGILELEAPINTNDERVIGEPVAFTIARLQGS